MLLNPIFESDAIEEGRGPARSQPAQAEERRGPERSQPAQAGGRGEAVTRQPAQAEEGRARREASPRRLTEDKKQRFLDKIRPFLNPPAPQRRGHQAVGYEVTVST